MGKDEIISRLAFMDLLQSIDRFLDTIKLCGLPNSKVSSELGGLYRMMMTTREKFATCRAIMIEESC